jgi:hypothetical protein
VSVSRSRFVSESQINSHLTILTVLKIFASTIFHRSLLAKVVSKKQLGSTNEMPAATKINFCLMLADRLDYLQ